MKEKPDFSGCRDPEFAETMWELNRIAIEQMKNNPFLKKDKKQMDHAGVFILGLLVGAAASFLSLVVGINRYLRKNSPQQTTNKENK